MDKRIRAVIVVQLGRLGDVIATRVAFASLKAHDPMIRVAAVVQEAYGELLHFDPCVDSVYLYRRVRGLAAFAAVAGLIGELRRFGADILLDVTGTPRSRYICLGYGRRRCAGWGRPWLYATRTRERRRREENYGREVARLLGLLGLDAIVTPPPLAAPAGSAALIRAAASWGPAPRVVIHPGASNTLRQWPIERFAALADHFCSSGVSVVLLGGPDDQATVRRIAATCRQPPPTYLTDSVVDLMAALAAGNAFVGLDSGPLHVATALGLPAVALYGPSTAYRSAPLHGSVSEVSVDLPCRPCAQVPGACERPTDSCMRRIQVSDVLEATLRLLERERSTCRKL
ncbi:MAG: glycosyltransferase family 9 protein [Candidatus Schekmanbacteria bacterium]|nr:glycosyltransferase family 9 protein [Candidatus Schekmanbacteria bacterium]